MVNSFRESLKYEDNYDVVKLLSIQRILENGIVSKEKISEAIKELSEVEKRKIIQLYMQQIQFVKNSINNYRCKIISKRKILNW